MNSRLLNPPLNQLLDRPFPNKRLGCPCLISISKSQTAWGLSGRRRSFQRNRSFSCGRARVGYCRNFLLDSCALTHSCCSLVYWIYCISYPLKLISLFYTYRVFLKLRKNGRHNSQHAWPTMLAVVASVLAVPCGCSGWEYITVFSVRYTTRK